MKTENGQSDEGKVTEEAGEKVDPKEATEESTEECTKETAEKPSAEELLSKLYELIQPRREEVFKRLGNHCHGNHALSDDQTNEEDEEREDWAKLYLKLCFHSKEAMEELKCVLEELEMSEACSVLREVPEPVTEEEKKEEEVVERPESPEVQIKATPYRDVILESAGTMVDCLIVTPKMLHLLEDLSVLNRDMVSKVLCRPNRPDRVRQLLEFLQKLGPESLSGFIEVLRETDQDFLANILAANVFA